MVQQMEPVIAAAAVVVVVVEAEPVHEEASGIDLFNY